MPRKVRFVDTGEYGTSDQGFQAPNKKYYSSKNAYDVIVADKEAYKGVYFQLQQILEIPDKPVPPVVLKEIIKYKGNYEVVQLILKRVGEAIREGLRTRHIENGFHAAKYIATFIGNQYSSVVRELESYTEIKERDYEAPVDISDRGHRNRHKDLSKLIGEI